MVREARSRSFRREPSLTQAQAPPTASRLETIRSRCRSTVPRAGVEGVRDLKWFIGSGNVGRSFAFAVDGFLFQAPVSYYSSAARWDLSPGYAGKHNIELAKPIEEPCLYCHASRAQPVAKTQNRYLDPPFLESGVGCERCHGPGQKHLKTHRDIVNPAKLDAARRDSICQQCHLTGAARVPSAGPRRRDVSAWRSALRSPDGLRVGARECRAGGNRSFRTTGQEQVQVGVGRTSVVRYLP